MIDMATKTSKRSVIKCSPTRVFKVRSILIVVRREFLMRCEAKHLCSPKLDCRNEYPFFLTIPIR